MIAVKVECDWCGTTVVLRGRINQQIPGWIRTKRKEGNSLDRKDLCPDCQNKGTARDRDVLLKLLDGRGKTLQQLSEESGLSYSRVNYVTKLLLAQGSVRKPFRGFFVKA